MGGEMDAHPSGVVFVTGNRVGPYTLLSRFAAQSGGTGLIRSALNQTLLSDPTNGGFLSVFHSEGEFLAVHAPADCGGAVKSEKDSDANSVDVTDNKVVYRLTYRSNIFLRAPLDNALGAADVVIDGFPFKWYFTTEADGVTPMDDNTEIFFSLDYTP